jgi:hypothetical protein
MSDGEHYLQSLREKENLKKVIIINMTQERLCQLNNFDGL